MTQKTTKRAGSFVTRDVAGPVRRVMPKSRVTAIALTATADVAVNASIVIPAVVLNQFSQVMSPTPTLEWRSSDLTVATVTNRGVVTGVSVGTATITARKASIVSGDCVVTVSATPAPPPDPPPPSPPSVLTTVTVTPSSIAVGDSAFAVAIDQNGLTLSSVVWQSTQPAVAAITSGGGVTALTAGRTEIVASLNGVSVAVELTVTAPVQPPPVPVPTLTTVTLAPSSLVVGAMATATARDQFGTILSVGVTWDSGNTALATVNSNGLVTGVAEGTTTITATHNTVSVSAPLTLLAAPAPPPVAPTLVRPVTNDSLAPSFIAELAFEAGPTVASFELRTTGGAVVQSWAFTFANTTTSLVQTLQVTSPVTGTYDVVGIVSAVTTAAARITLTVPAPPPPTPSILTTVVISPFSLVVGQTAIAVAKDQNGQLLTVAWSSSNLVIATVSNNGTVTALASGTVQISATYNSVIVSASLTITAPVVLPPPPGGKPLLSSADLTYLGAMRLSSTGTRLDFAYGQMTGRRVNGQVRLILSGNVTIGHPIYEFADTGAYSPIPSQAPRAALVKNWGDVYGGKRISWDTTGTLENTSNWSTGGLHWSEATQLLYWTYYNSYNVSGIPDWSLGASTLTGNSAVGYGPWRVSGGNKKGPWRCVHLTEHPTTGAMLCGSMLMSGNANAPWGPDVWAGTLPTEATPAGLMAADLPITKCLTYYPIFGQAQLDGTWTGTLRSCRRPGDYIYEPFPGTHPNSIDPLHNGGVGTWNELDQVQDMTWIDLPDKQGVIFTGHFAAGHEWYSTVLNNYACTHGVPSPVPITGPVSTDGWPFIGIFNPTDITAVQAGTKTDYTVDAVEWVNAVAKWNVVTNGITGIGSARAFTGHYFDAVGRKLYIASPEADSTIANYFQPLIHVFQVT